jgi:hypothetical protein
MSSLLNTQHLSNAEEEEEEEKKKEIPDRLLTFKYDMSV